MLNLYLLRHGKASKSAESGKDFDRELNKKGTAQCNRIGFILAGQNLTIDRIICSSAIRTKQTAGIVNHYLKSSDCQYFEDLYLANAQKITRFISMEGQGKNVLFVGHNFGISDVTEYLSGKKTEMATAQLVHIRFAVDDWAKVSAGTGQFVSTIVPDVHSY